MGGHRLKSGLFSRYVIVGISDVFGHNHADLQSVTPALAHDPSVNYSTAPRPKRRGFKFEKNSRKGCDRFEKKTSGLPMTTSMRTLLTRTKAMHLTGLLHHRYPNTHHTLRHPSLVQIPLLVRVTPLLRNLWQAGAFARGCAWLADRVWSRQLLVQNLRMPCHCKICL